MAKLRTHVTLKDVALHARCSTAVVSTVINNAKGNTQVSEETRRRVLESSRELMYRPNFASRSLVSRRSQTLGVYVPPSPGAGLAHSYESFILRGIDTGCRAHGYDLLVINLTGELTPDACFDKFAERRIDGLLVVHAEPTHTQLLDMIRTNPNVVLVDYPHADPQLNLVMFDNRAASRLPLEHLVKLGHQRIGFLGSCREPANADSIAREQAFVEMVNEIGLELKNEWIFNAHRLPRPLRPEEQVCHLEAKLGAAHIAKLGSSGPTAWIVYSDFVAALALPHLHDLGVRIPEQISLIGVDDSTFCEMVSPSLTAVRHPLEEMGKRAVEMLIEIAERPPDEPPRIGIHEIYSPTLVPRQSTAAPSRG
jgi:LacI family transcriptional regulator